MGLSHSPRIVTNGLQFCLDKDNFNCYKGPPIQNLATTITGPTQTGTGYSFTGSTETVNIPGLGSMTSQKVSGYNNYSAVSASCCPRLFYYVTGDGTVACSPSTTYTYAIVYKTTSGYTHPNYMYRYEYNGGTYVTEAGVHNTSNRTHLGDGWYWAWGTFTTSATTNLLYLRYFYYNYGTATDNMYVAKVLVTPGTYTGLHPKYWPDVGTTRATTASLYDLTTINTMTATSLTYASDGSFSFNGTSDYIDLGNPTALQLSSSITISAWVKPTTVTGLGNIFSKNQNSGYRFRIGSNNELWWYVSGNALVSSNNLVPNNTWTQVVVSGDSSGLKSYVNGVLVASNVTAYAPTTATSGNAYIGTYGGAEYFNGSIASVQIYNRALSATEVLQNYNALRGRFGL